MVTLLFPTQAGWRRVELPPTRLHNKQKCCHYTMQMMGQLWIIPFRLYSRSRDFFSCNTFIPTDNNLMSSAVSGVSCAGCSRVFVLCALFRTFVYCKRLFLSGTHVFFPFHAADIEQLLLQAVDDCCSEESDRLRVLVDDAHFDRTNASSHWTSAAHFETW